jgi:hypothetical protein
LRKTKYQNITFFLSYSNLCNLACKGLTSKGVVCAKDFIFKTKIEGLFQTLFYEVFSLKELISNPICIILCKQSHLAQLTIFIKNLVLFLKNMFLLV